ncbi:MAG: hypothetical protein FJX35_08040 [Alphaproteobacteria bacterium]|nr:hypothetical protein [Alphaproteobacteria bacterium]
MNRQTSSILPVDASQVSGRRTRPVDVERDLRPATSAEARKASARLQRPPRESDDDDHGYHIRYYGNDS